jgi:hypothetical protein
MIFLLYVIQVTLCESDVSLILSHYIGNWILQYYNSYNKNNSPTTIQKTGYANKYYEFFMLSLQVIIHFFRKLYLYLYIYIYIYIYIYLNIILLNIFYLNLELNKNKT